MEKCFVCEKEFQIGAMGEVKCEDGGVLVCIDCVDEFRDALEQDRFTQMMRQYFKMRGKENENLL